jgi:hypothetical protein
LKKLQKLTDGAWPLEVPKIEEEITLTHQLVQVLGIVEVHNQAYFGNTLERDPGKRSQIWTYPPNHVDIIRKAYLNWGSY